MKHMAYGKAALLGIFVLAGCYSYASDAINGPNYNTLQASPEFVTIKNGDSDRVILRLINDNNNGAITSYHVSAVGAGIRVDSSCTVPDLDQAHQTAASCNGYYRPIFDASKDTLVPTGDKLAQQFFVVGLAVGQYTFTVTPTSVNTGISRTITVVVNPITLGPALSKTAAVAGDTVTLTAPAGAVFAQSSAVTFPTGAAAVVARSADSTTITLVVGPGITGVATVTKVGTAANPAVPPVTLTTTNTLTTPALVPPTISPTTQIAGGTVILTAAPNTAFSPSSAITISSGPTPPITARAADSSTITFIVGPGDSGAITVTNVAVKNAPILAVSTLTTSNSLTLVPPVLVAPSTVSNLTPDIGVPITVTLGGSLRFISSTHVFIGGVEAGVSGVSADSSTATVLPMAFSSGLITYTNIALSFLNTVPLAVPGDKSVTVSGTFSGPTDPNANVAATASTITLTGSRSTAIADGGTITTLCNVAALGGGVKCRYFKLVTTAASMSGDLVWNAATHVDLGIYILTADGTGCVADIADDNGAENGNIGEHDTSPFNCTFSANINLTAGTFIVAIVDFSATAPPWFEFRISQP